MCVYSIFLSLHRTYTCDTVCYNLHCKYNPPRLPLDAPKGCVWAITILVSHTDRRVHRSWENKRERKRDCYEANVTPSGIESKPHTQEWSALVLCLGRQLKSNRIKSHSFVTLLIHSVIEWIHVCIYSSNILFLFIYFSFLF